MTTLTPHMLRPVLMPIPTIDGLRTPEQVQRQRDYARLALRRSAELSGAPLEGWAQDADGRPLPNDGWHWSISHKRLWAAGVVARTPVGIDIEHVVPRRDESLFDAVATAEEWVIIGGRSWENFYRLWTAKEAALKSRGFGIGKLGRCTIRSVIAPDHFEVMLDSDRVAVEHHWLGDHVCAVTPDESRIQWDRSDGGTGDSERQSVWTRPLP